MRAAKAASGKKNARAKLFRIKVISMGDTASGKSCLIKRCLWEFLQRRLSTLGRALLPSTM